MDDTLKSGIQGICEAVGNDRTRMMDIVRAVQTRYGSVSGEAMDLIAELVGTQRVEIESTVSFYAFLSTKPQGQVVIRLCNDIIDRMSGSARSAQALFDEELAG